MTGTSQIIQQMQQDLQNELITANQLLRLISMELQQLKFFTSPGGEFSANIKENAALITKLANMQHVNIENLPPMTRKQTDILPNENFGTAEQSSLRNETRHMDEG